MIPVTYRIYCKALDLIREGLEAMIGLMSEERAKKEGEYSSLGEQWGCRPGMGGRGFGGGARL